MSTEGNNNAKAYFDLDYVRVIQTRDCDWDDKLYEVRDSAGREYLMTDYQYDFASTTFTGTYTKIREIRGFENENGN